MRIWQSGLQQAFTLRLFMRIEYLPIWLLIGLQLISVFGLIPLMFFILLVYSKEEYFNNNRKLRKISSDNTKYSKCTININFDI